MDIDNDEKFYQLFVPDMALLSDYLRRAKGKDRTMAQFAEECGTNPYKFSRVLTQRIKKPLDEELIRSIVEHKDPSADFTLRDIMRANGMMPKEDKEFRDKHPGTGNYRNLRLTIKNLLTGEILSRGIQLYYDEMERVFDRPYMRDPVPADPGELLRIRSNFRFKVQVGEYNTWSFYHYARLLDYEAVQGSEISERYINRYISRLMYELSPLFLKDIWDEESLKDTMYSVVITERTLYNGIKESFSKIKVNNRISFIYLDIPGQRVVEEFIVPRNDGKVFESVFDMPVVDDFDDRDDDMDEYDD